MGSKFVSVHFSRVPVRWTGVAQPYRAPTSIHIQFFLQNDNEEL